MNHSLSNIGFASALAMSAMLLGCAGPGWPMFNQPATCQAPAPVVEVPVPPVSGYLTNGPTLTGELTGPPSPPTATERVVELSDRLVTRNAEITELRKRIAGLEIELVARDQSIQQAAEQVQLTRTELEQYRQRFSEWEAEALALQARIEEWNRRHGEAIQSLAERLSELILAYETEAAAAPLAVGAKQLLER